MELFLDYSNMRGLIRFISGIPETTPEIFASIAFNTSSKLLDYCIKYKIPLNWWGLFDYKESTSIELLEIALKNKSLIKFYPIKQNFHSKVIYVPGYGVYIGSANMTKKALFNNIESGVFLNMDDIYTNNVLDDLESYFFYLTTKFTVLLDEDLAKYKIFIANNKTQNGEKDIANEFEKQFKHLVYNDSAGLNEKDKNEYKKRYENEFVKEWRETLNELRDLMSIVSTSNAIPIWMDKQIPPGILTDQFLHAYYYSNVLKGKDEKSITICNELYEENKINRQIAIRDALNWWKSLEHAPSNENEYSTDWYLTNKALLSKNKILELKLEELEKIYLRNHAARNHARQMTKESLGLENIKHTINECTIAFAHYHFSFISKGKDIRRILYYVIYDDKEDISIRINNVLEKKSKYYIPHLGRSLLGEIVGWARPEEYPIRNNRVNKALRCLGFKVKIFSE